VKDDFWFYRQFCVIFFKKNLYFLSGFENLFYIELNGGVLSSANNKLINNKKRI